MRSGLFLAMMLAASSLAAAEKPLTIDQLLAQGWEIAGYASGYDNRTSLILFRHSGVNVLVQCGILYDVTRTPRTVVICYELGFNRRKMEDQRREAAEKEAATRRATDAQVLEDAECLIAAWIGRSLT